MVDAHEIAARQVRLAEIKRRIAEGTYESPALLDAAVSAFLRREGQRDIGDIDSSGRPTRPK